MNLIYNNSICTLKLLKTITLLHKSHQVGERPTPSTFFPRIIREFEDDDEPMIYGDNS